jgi:hypothetical protein
MLHASTGLTRRKNVFDDMKNLFWDYSIGGDCASAGPC